MKKLLIFLLPFIPATAFGDIQEVIEGTYDEAVNLTSDVMVNTAKYWAETDLCDVSEDCSIAMPWIVP